MSSCTVWLQGLSAGREVTEVSRELCFSSGQKFLEEELFSHMQTRLTSSLLKWSGKLIWSDSSNGLQLCYSARRVVTWGKKTQWAPDFAPGSSLETETFRKTIFVLPSHPVLLRQEAPCAGSKTAGLGMGYISPSEYFYFNRGHKEQEKIS